MMITDKSSIRILLGKKRFPAVQYLVRDLGLFPYLWSIGMGRFATLASRYRWVK